MTSSSPPPRYSVRAAKLQEDTEDALSLWGVALHRIEAGRRKIRWMYDKGCPAGEGRLFLLESDQSGIVGVTGIGRREFASGDERVRAGIMADFAVAPAHRSLMPALKLLRTSVTESLGQFDLLYSLPNERAEAVFLRARYRKVGEMVRYVRPARSTRFLESRMGGIWGRMAAPFVDTALLARDVARRRRIRTRLRYAERSDFDASFDSLWARRQTRSALISVRSSEMLTWRFLDREPSPDWRVSTVRDDGSDELRGYAVWRTEAGAAQVADFLWSDESAAAALLEQVAWRARGSGCSSVNLEFCGSAGIRAVLKSAGFWPRASHPVYCVPSESNAAAVHTNWYLTTFDRD